MRLNTPDDFWPKVATGEPDACWPWKAGVSKSGYGTFTIAGRNRSAHRVAYELANGVTLPPGRATVVMHICDVPICCNPRHLRLGTPKDNTRDAKAKGRMAPARKGSANEWAKFTDDEVREIRRLHNEGMSYPKLGAMFGMHPQNIGRICRREGYTEVI